MSKAGQIDKCMKLALDKSTTEEEALSAFKMARKLVHTHGYGIPVQEDYKGGRQVKLGIADMLGLVNAISSLANQIDLKVEYDFTGQSISPDLIVTYSGKKLRVEAMDEFITEAFAHTQKNKKKESLVKAMDELARALHRSEPKKKKNPFSSWFS